MSFTAVAPFPNDRSSDVFAPSYDDLDGEFFDQFLNFSPANSTHHEYSIAPDATALERSLSYSNSRDTSLGSYDDSLTQPEEWQALFTNNIAFYSESSGRAAVSDSELLSLEGISLESPQIPITTQSSLPSTPHPKSVPIARRKTRLADSFSHTKAASGNLERTLRSPIRKQSSASKMSRHSNHSQSELDSLGNKLQLDALKFKFDFEDNPTSPSIDSNTSIRPIKEEALSAFQPLSKQSFPQTRLDTPELCGTHSRKVSSNSTVPRTPEQLQTDSQFWPIATTPMSEQGSHVWWNHASKAPLAHPSPSGYHTNPQLATKSLAYQLQNDLHYEGNREVNIHARRGMDMGNGLMIQVPQQQQQAVIVDNSRVQRWYVNVSEGDGHRNASYPSRHPEYISREQRKHRSSRHAQQALSSPSSSSSKHASNNTLKKRKSSSNLRTKSSSSYPRTPQIPGSGGRTSDFVNYTPSDSKKILTGVAPSGSSKTKARREKEALDRRRKMSEAARRAVVAAGGDVGFLKGVGFEAEEEEEDVE
ncbi:hypothetical protein BJ875DRAFT_439425 [Amylocarpus encephaloides]|uniref:Developmental regulatory protein wetA n=1 Tax=Amylocarpus encephaloides TaxID=45428 RepID=A0A9P8C7K1_9HELO|nr:hypothetical protein BJ875DRAFT_439425 [Amylocarpus encephaloides]